MLERVFGTAFLLATFVSLPAGAQTSDGGARPVASGTKAGQGAGTPKADAGAKSLGDAGEGTNPTGDLPEGHHHHPSVEEMMGRKPQPTDSVDLEANLPIGTVEIELRDANERPRPHASITLGRIEQSIAKGEKRTRDELVTGDDGKVRVTGLPSGSGFAYRVSTKNGPATYAARPFNLRQDHGARVVLHAFEAETDPSNILTGLIVVAELRDDRVQFDEVLTVLNRGETAWVPNDVVLTLPPGFTALNGQQGMSDQGIDPTPLGARLRGTFPPGQHQIEFRWQLTSENSLARFLGEGGDVRVTVGASPHLAKVRAFAAVGESIKFEVEDFPRAVPETGQNGERLLVTQREIQPGDAPLGDIKLEITNIPGPGRGPLIATLATFALIGLGLYASQKRTTMTRLFGEDDHTAYEKDALLRELATLEAARRAGDVGPKTYERAKDEIRQALARLLVKEPTKTRSK